MKTLMVISEEMHAGLRLDKFLSLNKEIGSRNRALHLLKQGAVHCEALSSLKPSTRIDKNQTFKIFLPQEPVSCNLNPYSLPLSIVYEDSDLLVVNKPSGLVVHPSAGHPDKTLVNALLAHTKDLSMGFNEMRPGIVHRLDKETSGLMVVAKNNEAHDHLTQQFLKRSIGRIYLAASAGKISSVEGKIESSFIRHPSNRKKFTCEKNIKNQNLKGKWAKSQYKVLFQNNSSLNFLAFKLDTGRTHQIRIHSSEKLKTPILGDKLYGFNENQSLKLKKISLSLEERIALHAAILFFQHPRTKTTLRFYCPWPNNLTFLNPEFGVSLNELDLEELLQEWNTVGANF